MSDQHPVSVTSWLKENQTLVIFLVAQALAIATAGAGIIAYYVRMETRVSIMETRGAEYTVARMDEIKQRLTIIEQRQGRNEDTIRRLVDQFLKEQQPK
jgi:hypothetical protein